MNKLYIKEKCENCRGQGEYALKGDPSQIVKCRACGGTGHYTTTLYILKKDILKMLAEEVKKQ